MPVTTKKHSIKLPDKKIIRKNISSLLDIPLKKILYLSFFLPIFTIAIVLATQKNLPPEVPLYYGLPEGTEQLTSSVGLTIPSLVSISITIINLILAILLRNKFLQQMLILTSFAVSIFSSITIIKIILLVGSF